MLNKLDKNEFYYSNLDCTGDEFKNDEEKFRFEIPYYVKDVMIEGAIFRKIFVVDIREMSDERLNSIFKHFDYFQRMFTSKYIFQDYKNLPFNYRWNMEVIFLYDKNRNYNINKYSVLYDMEYTFKRFMTEDELRIYLNKNYGNARFSKFDVIKLKKDEKFYLRSFNYIHGSNGSGKTCLLNKLSNKLKVPVFSLDDKSLDLMSHINDKDYLRYYLYMLTGSYEIGEFSDYEKYINRLCQILEFTREHKNTLLLDDLRWNSLDARNKINLIDTLFEYSLNNEGVVFTGCNSSQKGLVKSRVYKPNIIDL